MTQKYQVKVSMKQAAIVETGIVLKQGDFGMQIEIEVLDFDATGTTPQIVFRKAMGAVESTTITVSSNKYTYTFKGTELDTPGKVFCDLKLKNSTTQRISTASFMFKVVADTLDGLAEESSSYSDTIAQIVDGMDSKFDDIRSTLKLQNIGVFNEGFVRSNGTITPIAGIYRYSEPIKVNPGDEYIYALFGSLSVYIIAGYENAADATPKSSACVTGQADTETPKSGTYIVPDGINYIRLTTIFRGSEYFILSTTKETKDIAQIKTDLNAQNIVCNWNGGFIKNADGTIVPASDLNNYGYTDFIPVIPGETYNYQAQGSGSVKIIAGYDSNQDIDLTFGVRGTDATARGTISIPDNIAYIRVCSNPVSLGYIRRNTSLNDVYSVINAFTPLTINTDATNNFKKRFESLRGKKINLVGDSITYLGFWIPFVAEETGADLQNYGVSGSSLAVGAGTATGQSIVERVCGLNGNTAIPDADIWVIFGGQNDNPNNIGKIYSTENTTVYGALKQICDNIRKRTNNPTLIICTPIQTSRAESYEIAIAIRHAAELYSAPIIDLYNESGITKSNLYKMTYDGVHPNIYGATAIAQSMSKGIANATGTTLKKTENGAIVKNYNSVRNLCDLGDLWYNCFVNGATVSVQNNTFFAVRNIPVVPGVKYYIYGEGRHKENASYYDARFVSAFNSSGSVISTTAYVRNEYTAPSNAAYVDISFFYKEQSSGGNMPGDTGFYYFSQYPITENQNFYISDNRASHKNLANDEIFYEMPRKATINFSFDDAVEQDSQIAQIFDDYGARCGFALITGSILKSLRMDWYRDTYRRGYSIMSHSNNGDTMGDNTDYTDAQLIEKFGNTAVDLEATGIKVRGWATPSSFLKRAYIPMLSKYYDYGFTSYFGAYDGTGTPYDTIETSPYLLKRVHVGTSTIENLKLAVDLAIENNGLLSFYGHAYEIDSELLDPAKLKELIAYIKDKEHQRLCHLYAPDEAMIYYYRTRYGD